MAELSLWRFVCGSAKGECKRGCSNFICFETFYHQWHQQNIVVGRRVRPGLKNLSRHQTSMWQSSLCRDLFVDLQVRNPRGDVEVSDHLYFSPTSVNIEI